MLKQKIETVYSERRKKLMASDPDACFIFFGAKEVTRNSSVHYPFRQDSSFYYLTEFDEPDAILVLVAGKSHLFVLERNLDQEIWTGERYGEERAKVIFQMDEAHPVQGFYSKLKDLLVDARRVY